MISFQSAIPTSQLRSRFKESAAAVKLWKGSWIAKSLIPRNLARFMHAGFAMLESGCCRAGFVQSVRARPDARADDLYLRESTLSGKWHSLRQEFGRCFIVVCAPQKWFDVQA